MRTYVWRVIGIALGLAACGPPPLAPSGGAHASVIEPALPLAPTPTVSTLADRIALERAAAEQDPRYAPRADEAGFVLSHPSGTIASVGTSGTRIEVGTHHLAIGLRSVDRALALSAAPPTLAASTLELDRGGGITEWWRSLPSGLEHGVTIASRPAGVGSLVLHVGLEGASAQAVSEETVSLVDAAGVRIARYTDLLVVDAGGAVVPARLEAHASVIDIVVDDAHASYPLVVDPLVAVLEATLPFPAGGARGGDINDDGSHVGLGGGSPGAVRFFTRTGTVWAADALVTTPAGSLGFGSSVAISGDGTRAIVGDASRSSPTGDQFAGIAYVLLRTGTTWAFETTLSAPVPGMYDAFGGAVAMSADGSRVLVGAPGSNFADGCVYVFARAGVTWALEATLVAMPGTGSGAGSSVALSDDGTAGVTGYEATFTTAAAASEFRRSGTTWTLGVTHTPTAPAAGPSQVALSGDGRWEALSYSVSGATHTTTFAFGGAAIGLNDVVGESASFSTDGSRLVLKDAISSGVVYTGPAGPTWLRNASSTFMEPSSLLALSGDGLRVLSYTNVYLIGSNTGDACTIDSNCVSGRCVDGVCCTSVCGGNNPSDCQACRSSLTGMANGTCASLSNPSAVTCRAAVSVCDIAETCAMGNMVCPTPDVVAAPGLVCRAALSICDVTETCTGSSNSCPTDVVAILGTLCRGSTGPCDPVELCTGSSALCPSEVILPAGSVCRAAAGTCDIVETCNGTTGACPSDAIFTAGAICRAAIDPSCDVAEICDGTHVACPADVVRPASTVCRASAGGCDLVESCSGLGGACPSDGFASSSTVCRAAVGVCDVAESCSGVSAPCPADRISPIGTLCGLRDPANACDVDDLCDGATTGCQARFAPSTTVCAPSSGTICDAPDLCAGTSATCVPTFVSSVTCRPSAGACDVLATVCG